jgi:hypothetical protein
MAESHRHMIQYIPTQQCYQLLYFYPLCTNSAVLPVALFLFICSLFNDTVSNSDHAALNDWIIVKREWERKWPWPNVRYYPGICVVGLRKTTRNSVRTDSDWAPARYQSEALMLELTCSVAICCQEQQCGYLIVRHCRAWNELAL